MLEEHSNKFKKQTRKVQTQKSSDLDLAHKRTNDVKQQSANTQQAVPDTILINKMFFIQFNMNSGIIIL
jgi:hypothetical protein